MGANFNTGQVSVGSGPTLIVAQNTGRKAVVITNLGTVAIYISYGSNSAAGPNVSVGAGQLLPGVVGASLSIPSTSAIWGISSGAAQSVSFLDA
jgi:hypothetical protein